jgi:hypothetical protein
MDSCESSVHLSLAYLPFAEKFLQASTYHTHAIVNESLLDVTHSDFVFACLSGNLCYAVSHQACA